MNHISMLNGIQDIIDWFYDLVEGLAALIPKIIYFLFAAFMSGIDAMQALIRKLAGLDTYYVEGNPVQGDPLTEFVYGILGLGESAPAYRGLNVVFWSLAIFGVIVLAITTIIAIVKSHYNEDTEGTNPVKYIYTALKAIFTFAIIPAVVVVGMQLATFTLKTLDNITSGQSGGEAIEGIYGPEAKEIFSGIRPETAAAGDQRNVYGRYDMFGFGSPTNSTTFGGMMFKACTYSANRMRGGYAGNSDTRIETYQGLKENLFGSGNCTAYSTLQTDDARREYIAYQVDYAFINALELNGSETLKFDEIGPALNKATGVSTMMQLFKFGNEVKSFTKFNVELVWLFYNLWQFNFIVAFGGGASIFGILISVILGLMTRLVKGAAMFLIYPALLGIAPLDNFKAFKSWGTTFMQQIMMAFGAIVGMNIVLLILPYLNNLQFFGIGVVDYIVNVIVLIAGLMLAKDFIGMVSGFVGGADAAGAGDGVKGGVAGAIKTGAGVTAKAGAAVAKTGLRVGKVGGKLAVNTVKTAVVAPISAGIKAKKAANRANAARKAETEASRAAAKASSLVGVHNSAANRIERKAQEDVRLGRGGAESATIRGVGTRAYNKAIAEGKTEEEAKKLADEAKVRSLLKVRGDDVRIKKHREEAEKQRERAKRAKEQAGSAAADAKKIAEENSLADKGGKFAATRATWSLYGNEQLADIWKGKRLRKKDESGNWVDEIDEETGKVKRQGGIWGDVRNVGKTLGDGFVKAIAEELGPALGLDKFLKGTGTLAKDSLATSGVQAWKFRQGGLADRALSSTSVGQKTKNIIEGAAGKLASQTQDPTGDKLVKKTAEDQKKATDAQTKSIQDLATAVGTQGEALKQLIEELKKKGGSGGSGGSGSST